MSTLSRRRPGTHLLVLAAYAVLAVGLSWPLVRHLSTHVPGSYTWAFDEYTFLWNSWWFRYSVLDLGQNPLFSTQTFYPLGISLALYTYNLFNAALSLPLQAFLALPAISNLSFLLATVLSGYGAFLLVDYLLSTRHNPAAPDPSPSESSVGAAWKVAAAFIGGLVFAFGSYRMVYAAIGHYELWTTTWIPFAVLYLVRAIDRPGWRNPVIAGVFVVLAMLCDMSFGVFIGMLAVILLIVALLSPSRKLPGFLEGGKGALVGRFAVAGLVAVVLYLPLLVPILREMARGYGLAGWGDAEKLSVDLVGLVTPTALHPLGGDWVETLRLTREGMARFRDVNTTFLGWASLALALAGAVRYRRQLAAWIAGVVVFGLFSLGPVLQINGRSIFDLDGLQVNVPLPFIVLHYLPVVNANRVPNRYGIVLMLALAVLAGFGARWLLAGAARAGRGAARWVGLPLGAVLAGVVLFEHAAVPLPLTDARIPAAYAAVAADPADVAVLQLPLGWRNSFGVQGAESTQTQYYQTYHGKPLLSGNISRNPPFAFDYFRRVPILESLITLETYGQVDAVRRAADRATAAEFVSFYNIGYVAVAPGVPGRPPYVDTRAAAVAYVEEVLPVVKIYDEDGWLLYRVQRPAVAANVTVDLGTGDPLATMALGDGWGDAETIQGASAQWAVAQGARLMLPGGEPVDHRLTVTASPFDYPGAGDQVLAVSVNRHRLPGKQTLASGWAAYSWDVPSAFLTEGPNKVQFEFARLDAPAEVLPGDGAIGATGVQAPVAIEVNSGGPAGFAYISVGPVKPGGEVQDGSVHQAGYNVAVIDARSGKLVDRRGFNVTDSGSETEAAAMAAFIDAVPRGQIVAVALQGESTAYLSDGVVAALRSIGGGVDLQTLRDVRDPSHAIIGVRGAAPGTALEAAGAGDGWLRAAPDRRTLAAAVDAVRWEAVGSP